MSRKMIELSPEEIGSGVEHVLQEAFVSRFVAAGMPLDAVMYSNAEHVSEGHRVLFTLEAAAIIGASLMGRPLVDCKEPSPDERHVLEKAG